MYVLHHCIKNKVSFKKIAALCEYLNIHNNIHSSTEISVDDFQSLLVGLNDPKFISYYKEIEIVAKERVSVQKKEFLKQKLIKEGNNKQEAIKNKDISNYINYIDAKENLKSIKSNPIHYSDEEEDIMNALEKGNGDLYGL